MISFTNGYLAETFKIGTFGVITQITYGISFDWARDSGCSVSADFYLLDEDPRTLNASQIASKAIQTKSSTCLQKRTYVNDSLGVTFNGLNLSTRKDIYVVRKLSGSGNIKNSSIGVAQVSYYELTPSMSVSPSNVIAGQEVTVSFTNKDPARDYTIRFMCGDATVYETTATDDSISVTTSKSWIDTARENGATITRSTLPNGSVIFSKENTTFTMYLYGDNSVTFIALDPTGGDHIMSDYKERVWTSSCTGYEYLLSRNDLLSRLYATFSSVQDVSFSEFSSRIRLPRFTQDTVDISMSEIPITVRGPAYDPPLLGNFMLLSYGIDVRSSRDLMTGESFVANIIGETDGCSFTAVFRYNDIELYREELSGYTISKVCPKEWFITAGISGNNPLPVDVDFIDQDGKKCTVFFTLHAPRLEVVCTPGVLTSGATSAISINNRDNEKIHVKLTTNGVTLAQRDLYTDSFDQLCPKEWFDISNVITNNSIQIQVIATDRIGREASATINMFAGDDMLPSITLLSTALVQHERASAFPDIYIAGYSKCTVSANVKKQTKAAIKSVVCMYGSTLEQMAPADKDDNYSITTRAALQGDTVFSVTATDERGLTSVKTIAVNNVYPYTPPSSTIDTLYRCDENGDEEAGGEYLTFRANARYDDKLPGNSITKFIMEIENGPSFPLESGVTHLYPHGRGTKKILLRVTIQDKLSDEITIERMMIGGISVLEAYNQLVDKYKPFNDDLEYIPVEIIGYPALMEAYYNTIDMRVFLESGLMPNIEVSSTDAAREADKLTAANLSPVAVANLSSCSDASAESAVLSMAKCLVRNSYQIKVGDSSYNSSTHKWTGTFIVTNYGDEEDTAESRSVTITITGDMETYIRQKLEKAMAKESDDITDLTKLFSLDNSAFAEEMKKYSMNSLSSFREICQACMDIMIQNGVSSTGGNLSYNSSLYSNLYTPYSQKASIIEAEMERRQIELDVVVGKYDARGNLIQPGAQTILDGERIEINDKLDFTGFLGDRLWKEFSSYRREDSLSNQNYISDGLTNSELFVNAEAFLDAAKHEIYKSAESQHSIEGDMHNILTMQEFQPLVYDFCVGNWIRVGVDGNTHKLRLYSYEIDFDTMDFDVKFTDLQKGRDTASDVNDLLSRVKSLSTSYQATSRNQAVDKNTSTIIQKMSASEDASVSSGGVSMNNGVINGRVESDDETGYEPTQYKITQRGIQMTEDNWQTSKQVLGTYTYHDPVTNTERDGYGVAADYLDGSMRIGDDGGIFNDDASLTIDKDGISITVDSEENMKGLRIKCGTGTAAKILLDVDENGELVVGDLKAASGTIATDGNISVSGNVSAGGTLTSSGKVTLRDGADITGDAAITGNVAIGGNAAVTGNETIGGTLTSTGLATLNGGMKITGDSEVAGGLTVKGSSKKYVTINTEGEVSSTGNASVGGTLHVKGAAALKGGLTVTGTSAVSSNETVGGTLTVTGATTLSKTLDVTKATTLGNTLTVNGKATLKAGLDVTGAAAVTGNETIGGTLGVTGNVTMSKKLDVTGNTTVGGTLSATGAFTTGGALSANGTANSAVGANIYNLLRNIVNTSSNGKRAMYPYCMASPYCGDIGNSTLDVNGERTISFESVFLQTISTSGYQVFLQAYGDGMCYVSSRTGTGFTVKGTPNLSFGWEVKAKSKSYGSRRLEAV